MSLESALAEEAREVMALLEGRRIQPAPRPQRDRAASPAGYTQSPVRSMLDVVEPAPVRSMLDVGDGAPMARHASIAGPTAGITRPPAVTQKVSSMLDPHAPPPARPPLRKRSSSPTPVFRSVLTPSVNLEEDYQFGGDSMLPRHDIPALPKRVTQGGKKGKGAMASVFSDEAPYRPQARHMSFGSGGRKSDSPGPRGGPGRSASPSTRKLNQNSLNLLTTPGKYVSDSGQLIDLHNAYRRLSDAALLKSGSSLAALPTKKFNRKTGEEFAPDGGVRLAKDYHGDEDVIDDSDDGHSDHDDDSTNRGRGRTRKSSEELNSVEETDEYKPKSLLTAVEDERKAIAGQQRYRSLLEPEVKVTGPDGNEKQEKLAKRGIHPSTAFDASSVSSVYDSDREEQLEDLRRAQKMNISISPIHSTPSAHRCIRQIIRGEYERFNDEASEGMRRQRMYLVASDMSPESEYALEWTIGTVLRDGDTLLAVYAADEEAAASVTVGTESNSPPIDPNARGEDVVRDLAPLSKILSNEATLTVAGSESGVNTPSQTEGSANVHDADYVGSTSIRGKATAQLGVTSPTGSRDPSTMDAAERQRLKYVDAITDRCISLLRKTKLQIRVVIEVFHCKSPKHMITEVIDFLSPTLVILGSRGRSALKGVLLGSFSNYLVTKSSVPVMVARKKLRKHSKSIGLRNQMRLSNMLSPSAGAKSRLEDAKIEKAISRG